MLMMMYINSTRCTQIITIVVYKLYYGVPCLWWINNINISKGVINQPFFHWEAHLTLCFCDK